MIFNAKETKYCPFYQGVGVEAICVKDKCACWEYDTHNPRYSVDRRRGYCGFTKGLSREDGTDD